MNAQTTQAMSLPHIAGDEDVAKIKKHMRAYTYFLNAADLLTALNKAAKETDHFLGLPTALNGIEQNDAGEYILADDTFYADSVPVLAYVGGQSKGSDGKNVPVIKGILAFGIPTVSVSLEKAPDLVAKILGKECRHVYFRNFRDASTPQAWEQGIATAPIGIEAFAASHARSAAEELDTDTFDAVWPPIRKKMIADSPALRDLLPSKAEIIKCIRSKSYAVGVYPKLEGLNLFLGIAQISVQVAESQTEPLDAEPIKQWARNRETVHEAFKQVTDEQLATLSAFDPAKAAATLGL